MKKLIVTLGILFGLYTHCIAQLNGHYVRTGGQYTRSDESFCFKGNRFEFEWDGSLATHKCSGQYEFKDDTITLNSDLQVKDLVQVKQHELKKLDSLYISISTVSGVQAYRTTLTINDSTRLDIVKERGSLLSFSKGSIQKFSISSDFVDRLMGGLNFKVDPNSTFVEVIIDDTHGLWNAYFEDLKFIIEGNRIICVSEVNYNFVHSPNAECK